MDLSEIVVTAGGLLCIGFTLWFFFGKGTTAAAGENAPVYACPMHPWIKSDDPAAECSVCGMKLVRS